MKSCLDLAYVDKLAKNNRGVKYLLVPVDLLSRYLRVEPLMTKKYATETAYVLYHDQKSLVFDSKDILGAFKAPCNESGIHSYSKFS